jgi:hypothetical protein
MTISFLILDYPPPKSRSLLRLSPLFVILQKSHMMVLFKLPYHNRFRNWKRPWNAHMSLPTLAVVGFPNQLTKPYSDSISSFNHQPTSGPNHAISTSCSWNFHRWTVERKGGHMDVCMPGKRLPSNPSHNLMHLRFSNLLPVEGFSDTNLIQN